MTFEDVDGNLDKVARHFPKLGVRTKDYEHLSPEDMTELLNGDTAQSWPDFKGKFVQQQESLGAIWVATPGKGGPLRLKSITVPAELGKALARELIQDEVPEGNLRTEIRRRIPGLTELPVDEDYGDCRREFAGYAEGGKKYAFYPGPGLDFHIVVPPITFKGKEKKLGQDITKQKLLKEELGLYAVLDLQGKLAAKQFHNMDLCGIRMVGTAEADSIELSAVELKKDNKVPSVMEAIAQAMAYRSLAHWAYVAAPGLSREKFHDPDRHVELFAICEWSGVGVISLDLSDDCTSVENLQVLKYPRRSEPSKFSLQKYALGQCHLTFCPLCRRYVEENVEERSRCGWQAWDQKSHSPKCMREVLEGQLG